MDSFRRFFSNKLVRPAVFQHWIAQGVDPHFITLSDDGEFLEELSRKLIEEFQEVLTATSHAEIISELADFEEVLDELKSLLKITPQDIAAVRTKHLNTKGDYSQRLFSRYFDIPLSTPEILIYIEKKSEKFPELNPATNQPLQSSHSSPENKFSKIPSSNLKFLVKSE